MDSELRPPLTPGESERNMVIWQLQHQLLEAKQHIHEFLGDAFRPHGVMTPAEVMELFATIPWPLDSHGPR